jgi:hypothetical protein
MPSRVRRMAPSLTMGWLSINSETFTAPRYTEATTTTDASTSSRPERVDGAVRKWIIPDTPASPLALWLPLSRAFQRANNLDADAHRDDRKRFVARAGSTSDLRRKAKGVESLSGAWTPSATLRIERLVALAPDERVIPVLGSPSGSESRSKPFHKNTVPRIDS